ncbi:GGDEF domain-containing protein [Poseidonibacter lekithochrous]|uniref:diguanylate cyclase n=1 Tax=Poseidonibacter TaxID=2321187 RepID=UPI001C091053|nr:MULTISPECIES: diguanylate cyclase [Poseidonibacter]MBU3013670.1 GGDEF domain-containing protein [Poseidonibacter lekithochrous]MDO6826967.1 diguanylate cyclase [Poseidonibacter sp. 1_MG-2023]
MKKRFVTYYILFNILVASFFCIYLYISYNQKKSLVLEHTKLTSLLVSEWIKGAFNASDYVLRDIIDRVPTSALKYPATDLLEHDKISKLIDKKRNTLAHSNGVGLNDENCIITHSPSIVGFNASKREWCYEPMHNPKMETYVSNMFISNINQMMVIQVRKFPNNKGLAGIGVNLSFFSQWLKKVNIGKYGVIAIADNNLKLLSRQPSLPLALGKEVNSSIVRNFISLNKKQYSYSNISPIDNENRLYSVQKVDNLPFIVVVGEAHRDWLNSWYKELYISILITLLVWIMAWIILKHYTRILKQKSELEKLSVTDQLTKLYNRHKLHEVLQNEFYRAERINYSFGVIILDIDNFKLINDTYGHNIGDNILQELAMLLKKNIRVSDTLGRWGGEEFLIIVPQGDTKSKQILAEKLRIIIEKHIFPTVTNITASFGISVYNKGDDIDSLIKKADDALYEVKENGRNQVRITYY